MNTDEKLDGLLREALAPAVKSPEGINTWLINHTRLGPAEEKAPSLWWLPILAALLLAGALGLLCAVLHPPLWAAAGLTLLVLSQILLVLILTLLGVRRYGLREAARL